MPYVIDWYIENRVIRLRFFGDLTQREFEDSNKDLGLFVKRGTPPLLLQVDFRQLNKFPQSLSKMLEPLQQFRSEDDPVVWTIILSSNRLYSFFGAMASKVINTPMSVFETQQEADALIARHLSDLAQPKAVEENP